MSKRTEDLAVRLEQGYVQLASYAEGLSAQEWAAPISQEGRSVGVLVHHVATMYPVEVGMAQIIANGQAVAGLTWDLVADMNANHALEHAQPDRSATLALLRRNGAERSSSHPGVDRCAAGHGRAQFALWRCPADAAVLA